MAEKPLNYIGESDESQLLDEVLKKVDIAVEEMENGEGDKSLALFDDTLISQGSKNIVDLEEEKVRFQRIIKKIHGQRNRAGYQRILAFAQRENKHLVMDDAKFIIRDLLLNGLIENVSTDVNDESFKVIEIEPTLLPSCTPKTQTKASTKKSKKTTKWRLQTTRRRRS